MPVTVLIPALGEKFKDFRDEISGDSYNWGPAINANNIKNFTFHHSVTKQTAKTDGNWKAEAEFIARLHINGRGWDGIGYRFVICSDGTVAYVGDLSHGGSAVANMNDVMFSACFVGDFTKELPTASQVHSAHLLAEHFLTQMPQYPNLSSWDQVKGHQEFSPTACPGSAWKVAGDNLYSRIVNDTWQGYPDPQPVGATQPPVEPPTVDPCSEYIKQIEDLTKANDQLKTELESWENAPPPPELPLEPEVPPSPTPEPLSTTLEPDWVKSFKRWIEHIFK